MTIPDYQSCMLPHLKILADGRTLKTSEANQLLADSFKLTDEERSIRLSSGKQLLMNNRFGWARTYLRKAGLIESPQRGTVRLTERGQQVLKEKPKQIGTQYLNQFEDFQRFYGRSSSEEPPATATPQQSSKTDSPDDRMASAFAESNQILREQILDQMSERSPQFFEDLVIQVLVAMGYGGSLEDAAQSVGRSGDEGIDGIIKEDPLGLDMIYVQAKRWANPVGRPEIQKFAGALLGQQARKGIFITSGKFTREAEEYSRKVDARIILIHGGQLADLMIRHKVGVQTVQHYEIKRLDFDFFEDS